MRRSRWQRLFSAAGASLLVLALFAGPAEATKAKAKPAYKSESRGLYPDLLQAAKRGEWSRADALARKADDPLAVTFSEWLYLTDNGTIPSFDQLSAFLAAHPTWPGRGAMLTKAEQAIPESLPAQAIVDWFAGREPRTGDGAVRLGEALVSTGQKAQGEALIRTAWIEQDFTPNAEARTLAQHRSLLAGDATAGRVARLLWQRRTSDANRILDLADDNVRAAAKARMTLIAQPARIGAVVSGLPSRIRDDSGILFEQTRALRRDGNIPGALPVALRAEVKDNAGRWWPERHALAREALNRGLYQDAYRLAAENGLSSGADFADAEWLAGWIALRFLNKPREASQHFLKLYGSVSYPVSKARGAYWAGRAAEEAGKFAEAATNYDLAAAYETTYYGQLAHQRLAQGEAKLTLRPQPADKAARKSGLAGGELARAAAIANQTGSEAVLRPFFIAMGEAAQSPEDYLYAGKLALDYGYPGFAVRVAKKAMQDNIVLTEIAYPMLSVPKGAGGPEGALVLGISRQESEFDPRAESPSGARGLMQLMPATAKHVAKQEHIQYSPARLEDPGYNMRLGTAYLGGLIDRFGGSYALAVAAYNAGPTNARNWINQYGDPRDPNIDAIDWVEKIPFPETRNYVQRVLENTQVYRSRLAHAPVTLQLHADLARPNGAPAYRENLIAYLPAGTSTRLAAAQERPPARDTKRDETRDAPERETASVEPTESLPPAPPAEKPAAAQALASTAPPAAATPPARVEVAEAAPQAVLSVSPPAQVIPAPVPEAKPAATRKAPAKPAGKSVSSAKTSKVAKKSRTDTDARDEVANAAPPVADPAPVGAPAVNPFGRGQPETIGVQSSCNRMILDLSGKPRCADQRAANE